MIVDSEHDTKPVTLNDIHNHTAVLQPLMFTNNRDHALG